MWNPDFYVAFGAPLYRLASTLSHRHDPTNISHIDRMGAIHITILVNIIDLLHVISNPKALRTDISRFFGPKTIPYRAFGAVLSLRVSQAECHYSEVFWKGSVQSKEPGQPSTTTTTTTTPTTTTMAPTTTKPPLGAEERVFFERDSLTNQNNLVL